MLNKGKPKRIPQLYEIFGVESDVKYSKIWREFAHSMVDWGSFQNYSIAMTHFCVAFDTAKRLFGKDTALLVYRAVTEDVQFLPNEILRAAKYVHDGGDKAAITELASKGYFIDEIDSNDLDVDSFLSDYEKPGNSKKDLSR